MDQRLLRTISHQFALDLQSVHGISHWKGVETIGFYLADRTGADKTVISYFAYLHDSQRLSEDDDPLHGLRAREFVQELVDQGTIKLGRRQLKQLLEACEIHSTTHAAPRDITIATCLDADRLDLWRVDIEPSPKLLFTEEGKMIAQDKSFYDTVITRQQ